MLRLAGLLSGSALTIAVLIATLGIPQFSVTTEPEVNVTPQSREHFAAEKNEVEARDQAAGLNSRPDSAPGRLAAPAAPPDTNTDAAADAFGQSAQADAEQTDVVPATQATAENPQPRVNAENSKSQMTFSDQEPLNWFAFWSPFRSEIAANGFVTELQRSTGLDYRVVKVKPGVYEVAFAYASDSDRQDKLERISAATGLDVSGG